MFNPFKRKPPGASGAAGGGMQTPPIEAQMLRNTLVPRIKHLNFERALREKGIPSGQMPVVEPLVGELIVTYAFDLPEQFVMANPTNMARAGISIADARALACANLKPRLSEIEYYEGPGVHLAVMGGELEACLLLVDEVWEDARTRFKPDHVVCVPRRDRLLISDGAGPQAIADLQRAAREFFVEVDDGHALSLQLMTRSGSGWRLIAQ